MKNAFILYTIFLLSSLNYLWGGDNDISIDQRFYELAQKYLDLIPYPNPKVHTEGLLTFVQKRVENATAILNENSTEARCSEILSAGAASVVTKSELEKSPGARALYYCDEIAEQYKSYLNNVYSYWEVKKLFAQAVLNLILQKGKI